MITMNWLWTGCSDQKTRVRYRIVVTIGWSEVKLNFPGSRINERTIQAKYKSANGLEMNARIYDIQEQAVHILPSSQIIPVIYPTMFSHVDMMTDCRLKQNRVDWRETTTEQIAFSFTKYSCRIDVTRTRNSFMENIGYDTISCK